MPASNLLASLRRGASHLRAAALNLLAPHFCRHCGRCDPGVQAAFCSSCAGAIGWIDSACARCGLPLKSPPRSTGGVDLPPPCGSCAAADLAFDLAACGGTYTGALRTAVLEHKFRRDAGAVPLLATALTRALAAPCIAARLPEVGAIATVPLHPVKRWLRGGDSLVVLARAVAASFPVAPAPCIRALLVKRRWTRPQARLAGSARRRNLRGAFRARRGMTAPAVVLLVDDVLTTGSTAAECARALKAAGARLVLLVAAARSE